jgi:peptidoglycan/LPS O-acetylase OafA/YrhL
MEPDKPQRLLSVDSLRGIAALSVVFFHVLYVPKPSPTVANYVANEIMNFGITGPFLFFIISGFSLCLTMPRHDRSVTPDLSFGISRFFRIAPAFFFMLMVTIARDYFFFGFGYSFSNILLSMSFLFNLVPGHQEGIVWASWTIGVEMLFYVAFLPLYRLGIKWQIVIILAALILFGILGCFVSIGYMYWSFIGYFPLFVFGMIAFELYSYVRTRDSAKILGRLLIGIGVTIIVLCIFENPVGRNLIFRFPVGVGYSAVLLGGVLCHPKVLSVKPLLFYGRISYSLYLVHAPIIYACSRLFSVVSANVSGDLAYVVCAIITLSIATVCAHMMYEFIEKPGIRLGAVLLKMISERSPANFLAARKSDPSTVLSER